MQTVNRELFEPKHDCWACENGECQILTVTHCKRSKKCGHYQTAMQRAAGLKKAQARLKELGVKVSKYSVLTQKNNRVSGN